MRPQIIPGHPHAVLDNGALERIIWQRGLWENASASPGPGVAGHLAAAVCDSTTGKEGFICRFVASTASTIISLITNQRQISNLNTSSLLGPQPSTTN